LLAVASLLDTLDRVLLSAHMGQHFLLMSVAPLLLLLCSPYPRADTIVQLFHSHACAVMR